jgi:hypothetical protein
MMAPAALAHDQTREPTSARNAPSSVAREKGDAMTRAQILGLFIVVMSVACSDDNGAKTQPTSESGAGAPAPQSGAGGSEAGAGAAGGGQAGTPVAGKAAAGSGGQSAAGSGGVAAGSGAGAPAGSGSGGQPSAAGSGGPSASGRLPDGTNPNAVNPYPDYKSEIYADDKLWMCKPGLQQNYCLENIADATEALPDGTFKPFMDDLRTDHPFDCIFWYPTVNRTEDPTSLDFSDPEPMLGSIRSQAARFSRVCNVYAPFYRQVSLNNGGDRELAYKDVVDSFKQYIANWNKGRYFVIYGHSQGTGHATRLIKEEVDTKPELRERLISTLLIGGGITADSFANIPLCAKVDQFGCSVGYRTYGEPTPPTGTAVPASLACVNPAAIGGGSAMLKGAFFHSKGSNYAPALGADFTGHFGLFRNFFTGECKDAPGGGQILEIDYANQADDKRAKFLDLSTEIGFGLHVFDYNFLMDDLVDLVRSQSEAMVKAKP